MGGPETARGMASADTVRRTMKPTTTGTSIRRMSRTAPRCFVWVESQVLGCLPLGPVGRRLVSANHCGGRHARFHALLSSRTMLYLIGMRLVTEYRAQMESRELNRGCRQAPQAQRPPSLFRAKARAVLQAARPQRPPTPNSEEPHFSSGLIQD